MDSTDDTIDLLIESVRRSAEVMGAEPTGRYFEACLDTYEDEFGPLDADVKNYLRLKAMEGLEQAEQ